MLDLSFRKLSLAAVWREDWLGATEDKGVGVCGRNAGKS